MTKEDAIKFISECNDKDYGFMVVAISAEDVGNVDNDLLDGFNSVQDEYKAKWLSILADKLNEEYQEEHFGKDFENVCAKCFEY